MKNWAKIKVFYTKITEHKTFLTDNVCYEGFHEIPKGYKKVQTGEVKRGDLVFHYHGGLMPTMKSKFVEPVEELGTDVEKHYYVIRKF